MVTNEQITPEGMVGSFASGFVSQAWSTGYESEMMKPHYEEFGTGTYQMTSKGLTKQEAAIGSNIITPVLQTPVECLIGWYHDHSDEYYIE